MEVIMVESQILWVNFSLASDLVSGQLGKIANAKVVWKLVKHTNKLNKRKVVLDYFPCFSLSLSPFSSSVGFGFWGMYLIWKPLWLVANLSRRQGSWLYDMSFSFVSLFIPVTFAKMRAQFCKNMTGLFRYGSAVQLRIREEYLCTLSRFNVFHSGSSGFG